MPALASLPQSESRTDALRDSAWSHLFNRTHTRGNRLEGFFEFLLATRVVCEDVASRIDTVSHSIASLYVALVSQIHEVERVFWRRENMRIRVWTIINHPDEGVEENISKAELELMDVLHDHDFDFSVIFRQDKPADQISPQGAFRVYPKD